MSERAAWGQWFAAAGRDDVHAALIDFYQRLDADIRSRGPTCWLSGKCCSFDTYGHRLYATGLEIAWLVQQLDTAGRARLAAAELPAMDGCPFQIDKLCTTHALRPLGCRVFFCDPSAQGWQNDLYERHLAELRAMHRRLGVPYAYVEWRRGLSGARASLARSSTSP